MIRPILGFALVTVLAVACQHSPSEPDQPDGITSASFVPASGTKLTPGAPVTFTATIGYHLSCSDSYTPNGGGSITLNISDQRGNELGPDVTRSVGQGPDTVTLSERINVPTAGASKIDALVIASPSALSCTLRFVSYSVSASYPVGG
jgi:hypothetical protein